MGGVIADPADARVDFYFAPVNADLFLAAEDETAKRAWCLVANEENGCVLLVEIVSEVMPNTSGIAHARCRHDDGAAFDIVDRLALLNSSW